MLFCGISSNKRVDFRSSTRYSALSRRRSIGTRFFKTVFRFEFSVVDSVKNHQKNEIYLLTQKVRSWGARTYKFKVAQQPNQESQLKTVFRFGFSIVDLVRKHSDFIQLSFFKQVMLKKYVLIYMHNVNTCGGK